MTALRVFLVDDHPLFRAGLRSLVETQADMVVVGEADDGETAVPAVLEARPDVVVLDVSMKGMGGIEAARRIHDARPEVRILGLSAHEDPGYARRMLACGASGYAVKHAAAAVLAGAIRTVASGGTFVDRDLAGYVGCADRPARDDAPGRADAADLSRVQLAVLQALARGRTLAGVADELRLTREAAEAERARAMDALGLRTRVDLVRHAIRSGWMAGD